MAQYTLEQVQNAFIRADKAGDTAAATKLAKQLQSMKQQAPAPEREMGNAVDLLKGVKSGFDKTAYALADLAPDLPISDETRDNWNNHLLVRSLGLVLPDAEQRQAELDAGKAQADKTTLGGVGRFAGEVAPALAGGVATAGLGLGRAALTQAAIGYGTTPGDTATRATNAGLAALGEGVGRAAPKLLSRLAQPIRPNPAAQRLMDQGNLPTPGAALGPASKKIEESAASLPGAGAFINRAFREGMADANRIALEQGGLKVSAPGFVGQGQISAQFDDLFKKALADVSFDMKAESFDKGLQKILRKNDLDKKGINDVLRFVNSRAKNLGIDEAQEGGLRQLLSGKDLQAFLTEIGERQAQFSGSTGFKARLYSAYGDLKKLVEKELLKQPQNSPEAVKALKDVRKSYALTVPAIKAGETSAALRGQAFTEGKPALEVRNIPDGGIFTPEGYAQALKGNAKARGRLAGLRKGQDPLSQFSTDFNQVYGNRYQDSGTATRAAITGVAMGLGGFLGDQTNDAGFATNAVGSLAGAAGLAAALYSPVGRKYLLGNSKEMRALAEALRSMAPASGTIGAATLPQTYQE